MIWSLLTFDNNSLDEEEKGLFNVRCTLASGEISNLHSLSDLSLRLKVWCLSSNLNLQVVHPGMQMSFRGTRPKGLLLRLMMMLRLMVMTMLMPLMMTMMRNEGDDTDNDDDGADIDGEV